MLWLQKTPNGKAGFRHTWGVKWSPSPGWIGQMVAVRLITIACKNGGITFIFINKETFFSRYAFPLFYRFVCCRSPRWKQKCSVLFEIQTECLPLRRQGGRSRQTKQEVLTSSKIGRQSRLQSRRSDAAQVSWALSWCLLPQLSAKFKRVTPLNGSCLLPSKLLLQGIPADSTRAFWWLQSILGWIITFMFQPKSKMEAFILFWSSLTSV